MPLRVLLSVLALLLLGNLGEAATHTVRGRITDAEGKGVAGVHVATAWTVTPQGATARAGVRTDAQGRFAIEREYTGTPLVLLALDGLAKRGAILNVDRAGLNRETVAVLQPCVKVHGKLSTDGGKYYPANAVGWVTVREPRSHLLRIEHDKGDYAFRLPPGDYEFTVLGLDMRPTQVRLALRPGKGETALETIDLEEHIGRLSPGTVAPPIAYAEASRGVTDAIAHHHFPTRWTLCYFWAHR